MGRRAKTYKELKEGEVVDFHTDLDKEDLKNIEIIKDYLPSMGITPNNRAAIKQALYYLAKDIKTMGEEGEVVDLK